MRGTQVDASGFGEFLLKARLVKEKAAPYYVPSCASSLRYPQREIH